PSLPPEPNGWLLFVRESTIFARKFNAAALKLEGEALPAAERAGYTSTLGLAHFSVSETGVLVYGQGSETNGLVWLSRAGKPSPIAVPVGSYRMPRLAPDGNKAAVSHTETQSGNADIWLIDLQRGVPTRFTFDPAPDFFPIWSPDGTQIVFG